MRKQTLIVVVAAMAGLYPSLTRAAMQNVTVRDRAQALCYADVMRLCNDVVPDEDQIAACMAAKRSQLSLDCRVVFDQGTQMSK